MQDSSWRCRSIALLEAERRRSADTHLMAFPISSLPGIDIYLKDESSHLTGSLKHRLAGSLLLYGICNGKIDEGTTLIEASSGSTAVSEAYYARLLGLDFIAVLPRSTSTSKVEAIIRQGGRCEFVDNPSSMYEVAAQLAAQCNGYYLDQFTFAERATDWRGNNNIAESIYAQLQAERHPIPSWIVMSAGTGGTSATIGRFIRYRCFDTKLCVPDAEFSAFYDGWRARDPGTVCQRPSRIEGIGRPRMERSFVPEVVDEMVRIPDVASLAAMRVLSRALGRKVGGSTGTNFVGLLWVAERMRQAGQTGSIVTLICDGGERYSETYFNDAWLSQQGLETGPFEKMVEEFLDTGRFDQRLIGAG